MADGTNQPPRPSDVAARAQLTGPAAQGDMDRVCLPCAGQISVEACYTDAWCTPLTNGAVRVEDATGVVVDGSLMTEPLAAHGQQDGDAPTAPLATMGTTPLIEVALGITEVSIVPNGGGEADGGMDELGQALASFRDNALGKLAPYVIEWETRGLLSISDAQLRGLGRGLSEWYEGEVGFWGGVSTFTVTQYQRAADWYDAYVARQTPVEKFLLRWGGPIGQGIVYGTSVVETTWEGVTSLFEGIEDLGEFLDLIMQAMRDLASGSVDVMQAALDSLRRLPGELGEVFAQLIDNGQDWIERLVLIASETNAFEYVFRILMAVAMNMTPNFWAEMYGVVSGFILPEVLIEVILAVIAALTGGSGIPILIGRFAAFVAKLRRLARSTRSLGILADILEAFGRGIRALARIGRGLHDEIEAMTRAGADGIARIRRRLNQYTIEIDPNTLGMNGGNIRIVRKVDIDFDHILSGEVRRNADGTFRAVGGHYRRSPNVRVIEDIGVPDANGVTRGRIAVRGPDGQWVTKRAETSFFPDHWSRRQTEQEIASAFQNSRRIVDPVSGGTSWIGRTPSGVPVQGYYNPTGGASTAFPLHGVR